MNHFKFYSIISTILYSAATFVSVLSITSCSDDDPIIEPIVNESVIVINEGNYGSPTGEISLYDIADRVVLNDVYAGSNTDALGDTFQSLSLIGDKYYAVVQTSGHIAILDTSDFTSLGRISGMAVPRYLSTVDGVTGYVSTGFGNDLIYKVSLSDRTVLGQLTLPGITNQILVEDGLHVIAAETGVYLLDPNQDLFVDTLIVGSNATDMKMDVNGDIWVSCAGQSWPPEVPATLHKINVSNRTSEEIMSFDSFGGSAHLDINGSKDTLFIVNDGIYKIPTSNPTAIQKIFDTPVGGTIYGLGVDPITSEVYAADAVDFAQNGLVYRLKSDGTQVDDFSVGLIPNGFLFKE